MTAKFGLLIDAKTKGENNIKRLGNSMQGVEGKAKNLGMAVRGVGSAFKALFAAAAVAGFSAFVKGAIDSADAFGKLSTRTGIAADKLQAYANAGKLADVSQSDLETGLRTLARTQGEAADGVKTYSEAYAKLGLSVKKADGSLKPSDELLGEIADKFADLPNGPEKAAIAMDIFGRSGSKLITLLNGGTEALERFNYETSENFAQNAEYFNDQISILQIQFEGFRMQLADALLPALNAILEVFSDLFDSGTDFGPLFKTIEVGVRGVGAVVLGLVQSMRFFTRVLTDLVSIANLVRQGKFGEALNVAQVGLEDTRSQFFKDMQAQQKVLFGSSEAGASYFQRSTGGFTPVQVTPGSTTGTAGTAGKPPKQVSADVLRLTKEINAARLAGNRLKEIDLGYDLAIQQLKEKGITGNNRELEQSNLLTNYTLDRLDVVRAMGEAQDQVNTKLTESQQLFEDMKTTVKEGLGNAIMGLIEGTKSLGQSLSGILRQLGSMFLQFGMGKLFSFLPFAKGGVFAQNNVVPFAYGGVVNKPTLFPMARGMGLMGEAGPEAIMPLRRGRGGRLGVEAAGGGMTTVNVSVDASGSSVQGDSAQASQLGKAIGVAVQTEILKQKRPGGLLATV
tara:strand:+ start:109 stop:1977 length:1869 start_codon:yes stop_codon:yes gene_type:complete